MNANPVECFLTFSHSLDWIQERYTCPSLALHPQQDSFVAQSNGNYMALFSAQRPYRMNKRRRYEGHKVSGDEAVRLHGRSIHSTNRSIAKSSSPSGLSFTVLYTNTWLNNYKYTNESHIERDIQICYTNIKGTCWAFAVNICLTSE